MAEQAQSDDALRPQSSAAGELDALSTLSLSLSNLVSIAGAALSALPLRALPLQINAALPVHAPPDATAHMYAPPAMSAFIDELGADLTTEAERARDIIARLDVRETDDEADARELEQLEQEMRAANEEFASAAQDAADLRDELRALVTATAAEHAQARAELARAAEPAPSGEAKAELNS